MAKAVPVPGTDDPVQKPPAKHKKKRRVKPVGACFILMPFKEPFNTYYESVIRPAVEATNLQPLRGDSLFRPSPIMGDVWQMIQNAVVLVAELTEKNANVFYELGLAHAIGKPVVLISETMDDVPFDLQPLRVILYNKSNPAWGIGLRSQITSAISESLPNPVEAVPPMFRKRVKSQAPEDSELSMRLARIERQMSYLTERGLSQFGDDAPESELRWLAERVNKIHSRSDAVHVAGEAIRNGTPFGRVRELLSRHIGPTQTEIVLKEAIGSFRSHSISKKKK